jgi:hypothetical protein
MLGRFPLSQVNRYLAHKQHLLPASQASDPVQATRDIAALHATDATGPYLALWARVTGFQRDALDEALYERRSLARVLVMRTTLHLIPSDEVASCLRPYLEQRRVRESRELERMLVQAGLAPDQGAGPLLDKLRDQVLDHLASQGPCTVQQLNRAIPELATKVKHSVGKSYEGSFSVGSRLVPGLCSLGLLIRARPRGSWRSNLYEYATLNQWLPVVDLDATTPEQARTWLVRSYLSAFGPATSADVQWWTGFSRRDTHNALVRLGSELGRIAVEGLGDDYLMLGDDFSRLQSLGPAEVPAVFYLPALDPYMMGYRNRSRFLATEHREKILDRAGNAMPTVWVNSRVAGAWAQRRDGGVAYRLFESVDEPLQYRLEQKRWELEEFLEGDHLGQRTHTPFTRGLAQASA